MIPTNIKEITELETRLSEYSGEDRIISSHELVTELGNAPVSSYTFATGVKTLDRLLSNVEAGELIVVSGTTGAGKTTFLTTVTKNIAHETPVAWFTLEVTQRQFLAKFGNDVPLFYTPAKNTENNVKWLIERIIEAKLKYNVKMIFIDHLHQIFSVDKFNGKNLSLELGDIVARIKQLAIEYNLVIWLIAHGTDDKQAHTREPKMTDVRDSGMIIRLADIVMGVWRIPNKFDGNETSVGEIGEEDTKTKVRVWKNRRTGKLGYFTMNFEDGRLIEIAMEYTAPKKDYKKFIPKNNEPNDNSVFDGIF